MTDNIIKHRELSQILQNSRVFVTVTLFEVGYVVLLGPSL